MRIAAISYLSHAEHVCYPFGTVHESVAPLVDEYWVCTATEEDDAIAARVETTGVLSRVLHVVREPNDIGRLLSASFCAVRDVSSADVFILVQADTAACGAALAPFLVGLARTNHRYAAAQLGCADARLYHHFAHGWGYTVLGRDVPGEFVGDGVLPRSAHFMVVTPNVMCLHLGYLSTDALAAHYGINGHVWNDPSQLVLHALHASDRDEFVREVLRRHARDRRTPLSVSEFVLDHAFGGFIERLGLAGDRERVLQLARECDPGWPTS